MSEKMAWNHVSRIPEKLGLSQSVVRRHSQLSTSWCRRKISDMMAIKAQ